MALRRLRVGQLRCIESAELALDPARNFIYGPNGSGKTTLLEACHLLGRGRSFRTRRNAKLVRHGQSGFSVFGALDAPGGPERVGVGFAEARLAIRMDGQEVRGTSALSRALEVHVIEPGVHGLVDGGPGERRRFLDWGVFHVEHAYLDRWRAYRRVLSQRNAALRSGSAGRELDIWTRQLVDAARPVDRDRRDYVEELSGIVAEFGQILLKRPVELRYRAGWDAAETLGVVLERGVDRDRKLGSTQSGPHRAEIEIRMDNAPARESASRGQQKLLAAALVLAQVRLDRGARRPNVLLLVDDPASELDAGAFERLCGILENLPTQLILTGIEPPDGALLGGGKAFHVEQGSIKEVYTGSV